MRIRTFAESIPVSHLMFALLAPAAFLASGCGSKALRAPVGKADAGTPPPSTLTEQDGDAPGEPEAAPRPDATVDATGLPEDGETSGHPEAYPFPQAIVDAARGQEYGSQPDMGIEDGGTAVDAEPPYQADRCRMDLRFSRTVDLDDVTLGHSARDVAREFAKNGPGLLRWFDGTETILNITADISQATVAIDDSPPFQGYCQRFMHISGVSFTINTADGRLQETLVSSLTAADAGGPILSIWPDLSLDLDQVHGSLQLPAEWRPPDQDRRKLVFSTNARVNLTSPYCLTDETRDQSPTSDCTAHSGKIVYYGIAGAIPTTLIQLVGQWDWQ